MLQDKLDHGWPENEEVILKDKRFQRCKKKERRDEDDEDDDGDEEDDTCRRFFEKNPSQALSGITKLHQQATPNSVWGEVQEVRAGTATKRMSIRHKNQCLCFCGT